MREGSAAIDTLIVERATRNVRILFWLFTFALLIGSHYPKLQVGPPGDSPDKLLHFFAFGAWTVLFWASRYVRNVLLVFLGTVLFAIFDEVTQAIPVLNRSADMWDFVADCTGGLVAVIWIYALGPTGVSSVVVRRREELLAKATWILFDSPMNVGNLAVATVFGALVGGGSLVVILKANPVIGSVTSFILGVGVGGIAGFIIAMEVGRRKMLQRIPGTSQVLAEIPEASKRQILLVTLLYTAIAVVVLTVLYITAIFLSSTIPFLGWISRQHESLDVNLALMFDIALVGVIGGMVVRRSRVRLARIVAAGGQRCVGCRQNLQGVPDEGGSGRCPECGHPFQRD